MTVLKFMSDGYIWFISILASSDSLFSFKLCFSDLGIMSHSELCFGHFTCYVRSLLVLFKSFILVGNICLSLACRLWPTLYGLQSNENFSFLISCNANPFCISFFLFFSSSTWHFHWILSGTTLGMDGISMAEWVVFTRLLIWKVLPLTYSLAIQCQWVFYAVFAGRVSSLPFS